MEKRFTIAPPEQWVRFSDERELLAYLKKNQLVSKSAVEPKTLYHHDVFTGEMLRCSVVGYVNQYSTVIDLEGELTCIDPRFLLEMQQDKSYCVIDVETPNHNNDRISSIAVAVVQAGELISCHSYLVNPEVPFDAFNSKLTGIDARTVSDAPIFPEVWNKIRDQIRASVVVAHNALFDLSVLKKTLLAYDIHEDHLDYVCTMRLAQKVQPDIKKYGLKALCEYYEIPLDHHKAESDCTACAQLLIEFTSSGRQISRYVEKYLLDEESTPSEEEKETKDSSEELGQYSMFHASETTSSLRDLNLVVTALIADNQLTEGEVLFLRNWMEQNQKLRGNYPFDLIFQLLSEALEDGILTQDELDYLQENMEVLLDPVKWCGCQTDSVAITGKNICLTGDFDKASRSEVESELAAQGACMQKGVTRKTDYVVVGGKGSTLWAAGNYGTKVKKALELQEKGLPVQIVREEEFFKQLEGVAAK